MGWLRFSSRLILLLSFAGLFCWGCVPADTSNVSEPVDATVSITTKDPQEVTASTSSVSAVPAQSESGSAASVQDSVAAATAYQEGINIASSAYVLSQSAFSTDDWGLVASRWQRAANKLKAIQPTAENYSAAQQKIADYTRQQEAAITKIESLNTIPTYQPATPRPASTHAAIIQSSNGSRKVTVPIVRRLQGTPVVRVSFSNANRVRTYEMILDTGASRTLITRRMANELGVVATERMVAATASQAQVTFDVGKVDAVSIDEISLTDARVSIGEAVSIGLLGNDFLRGYDLSIQTRLGVVELVEAR